MHPRPRTAVAVLAAAFLVTVSCVTALAKTTIETDHASAGDVSATLTYRQDLMSAVAPYSDLRLEITRDGTLRYDAAVDSPICGTACWPAGPKALNLVDLAGNGEPDVLVNVYSGGEHCCNAVVIHAFTPATDTYSTINHTWGDPGYELEQLAGGRQLELVSADDRFAYSFAAYAFSGLPLQIWRLQGARLIDVTRDYRGKIRADAKRWWSAYSSARKGEFGLGYLAAWAADEYNLGRGATVTAQLQALANAHELRSSPGFGPGGARFIALLNSFLRKTGYIK